MRSALRHPFRTFVDWAVHRLAQPAHLDCQIRAAGIRDQLSDDMGGDQ